MENKINPEHFKLYIQLLNQAFEIEKKTAKIREPNSIIRNIKRLKELFETSLPEFEDEQAGLFVYDPLGEPYDETRTDCNASIAGEETENLKISEVIKPIIYLKKMNGGNQIIQKGVVVVKASKNI